MKSRTALAYPTSRPTPGSSSGSITSDRNGGGSRIADHLRVVETGRGRRVGSLRGAPRLVDHGRERVALGVVPRDRLVVAVDQRIDRRRPRVPAPRRRGRRTTRTTTVMSACPELTSSAGPNSSGIVPTVPTSYRRPGVVVEDAGENARSEDGDDEQAGEHEERRPTQPGADFADRGEGDRRCAHDDSSPRPTERRNTSDSSGGPNEQVDDPARPRQRTSSTSSRSVVGRNPEAHRPVRSVVDDLPAGRHDPFGPDGLGAANFTVTSRTGDRSRMAATSPSSTTRPSVDDHDVAADVADEVELMAAEQHGRRRVRPARASIAFIVSTAIGSRPENGSSRISRSGSCTSAMASCTRCWLPARQGLHLVVRPVVEPQPVEPTVGGRARPLPPSVRPAGRSRRAARERASSGTCPRSAGM